VPKVKRELRGLALPPHEVLSQLQFCRADCVLFHEYFHGDNGAAIGASHQTGWSGVVATRIESCGSVDVAQLREPGKRPVFARAWAAPDLQKQEGTP
jgi:hypothetical protein